MKTDEPNATAATTTAAHRLHRDYMDLLKDPIPFAVAAPNPKNTFDFHFCIFGAPETPYEGGYYHGRIVFPPEFPFKPPTFLFLTPTGRFEISKPICLSISQYEPKTWSSSWTLSTILTGLISFMNEETPTFGSMTTSAECKHLLAKTSKEHNLKSEIFCELFPTVVARIRKELEKKASSDCLSPESNSRSSEAEEAAGTQEDESDLDSDFSE